MRSGGEFALLQVLTEGHAEPAVISLQVPQGSRGHVSTCRASERAPEWWEPQQEWSSSGLCVSFICLAFYSSELQLDFLVPSCLESTGQWLGLNSQVPGLALAQCSENSKSGSAQIHREVQLWRDRLDVFHKERTTVSVLCEESQIGVFSVAKLSWKLRSAQ